MTAVSSMTLISHNRASSKPPATAYPLTAAIKGFLVNIHEGPYINREIMSYVLERAERETVQTMGPLFMGRMSAFPVLSSCRS